MPNHTRNLELRKYTSRHEQGHFGTYVCLVHMNNTTWRISSDTYFTSDLAAACLTLASSSPSKCITASTDRDWMLEICWINIFRNYNVFGKQHRQIIEIFWLIGVSLKVGFYPCWPCRTFKIAVDTVEASSFLGKLTPHKNIWVLK